MPIYTALVTVLAVCLYFMTGLLVANARTKFGISPPATTGNPDFERVFRVQMNTLEWMPIFLPLLWLFAVYLSDWGAAVIGARLDRRAIDLRARLFRRRREEASRLLHPGTGIRRVVDRSAGRHHPAPGARRIKLTPPRVLAGFPMAAFTRGITSSAINCIERLASAGSAQSMPA